VLKVKKGWKNISGSFARKDGSKLPPPPAPPKKKINHFL